MLRAESEPHVPDARVAPETLEALRQFDTCAIANAIERFQVRLRNEGYCGPGLRCIFGEFPTVVGYAFTSRIKTANPPFPGEHYYDRTDWWSALAGWTSPHIAVIADMDDHPGRGAVAGELHCTILQRLGCAALVTNGAVRDLPAVRRLGFPLFAAHATVGHAYIHRIDFGQPVAIFGLNIHPGDLLCGDCHGLLSIPKEIADGIPAVVQEIQRHERKVIDLCRNPAFSIEKLREAVQTL